MWEGEIDLLDAVKAGDIELTGPRWIVSGLPRWLMLSPIAHRAGGQGGAGRHLAPPPPDRES